jgi:hypothetical protein
VSGTADETTIENSTFSGNRGAEGGAIEWYSDQALTLTGNTFTGNAASDGADGGGALLMWPEGTPGNTTNAVQISDNVFGGPTVSDGNTARSSGGGAFISLEPNQPLTLTGNTFQNNAIAGAAANAAWRVGGGLFLDVENGGTPFQVTQSHNTFKDNLISQPLLTVPPNVLTGGAGEWITGLTVTSTADSFIGNQITVNDGGPPEGGGVGAIATAPINLEPALPAAFNARNDLFSGNSVAAGGWGGAIYVGIPDPNCTSNCPASTAQLKDSTVVGNSVVAGTGSEGGAIWGNPGDILSVSNSILYGNTPKPEIFGFTSSHPTFAHSDVCNEAGGPTLSGSGLMCKNPALAAGGAETNASPTIDAGLNTLIPAGLTTDLAGHPRKAASRVSCAGALGPAIVDMGAFEATFKQLPTCNAKAGILSGRLTDTNGHASVKLSCPGGYLFCTGTVTIAHQHLTLGSAHFKIRHGQTAMVSVPLSQTAVNKLGKVKSAPVLITAAGHDSATNQGTSHRQATLELPSSG